MEPTEQKCTAESPSFPHPRLGQYKARNNFADQRERRMRLLKEQKEKRSELFNASRGLIEELGTLPEEHDMEWTAVKTKPRRQRVYKERLMLSEWMVHVPEDLAELWYLVPCPEGHRTLVVATAAEFRFFWLKSKMEDMSCLSQRSEYNDFIFLSLPYHQSNVPTMTAVMATEKLFGQDGPALDGLLFYHSEAHYIPGHTPLVAWLKPNMMSTVLSIPVAAVYLHNTERKMKKKHRRFCKHLEKSQEVDDHCDASTADMDVQFIDTTEDKCSETHAVDLELIDTE